MGEIALDASVVIGFLEPTDANHERAVRALRECVHDRFVLPASAYSEALVRPLAIGAEEHVETFVERLQVDVVPADREVAWLAAKLRSGDGGLRLPDALVLATARLRGARLLSFDERLVQLAGGPAQS